MTPAEMLTRCATARVNGDRDVHLCRVTTKEVEVDQLVAVESFLLGYVRATSRTGNEWNVWIAVDVGEAESWARRELRQAETVVAP